MRNSVINTFGRKLRLALIGGGVGSFIGPIHRSGATMHECYDIVAGVFSSSAEKSLTAAKLFDVSRGYADAQQLIAEESAREDGAEVLAILTPNDSHFDLAMAAIEAGMHVFCEKPLTNDLSAALKLQAQAEKHKTLFAVAYCYSAYPMVRQAKAMIAEGLLGNIHILNSDYIQGHLAQLTEAELAGENWHTLPEKAGPSLIVGDIATHSYHLLSFVSGMLPLALCADILPTVPGRAADDYAGFLMRYENGARATMQITQAAAGAVHGLSFRIFGEKGGLEWHQEQPNELIYRPLNEPMQVFTRGGKGVHPAAASVTHVAIGHPEGYREAFANVYTELAEAIVARHLKQPEPDYLWYPRLQEGVEGVRFIEAAVKSRDSDSAWVSLKEHAK